jgi:hypothetical protein
MPSVCPPETSKDELSLTTTGFCSGIFFCASSLEILVFLVGGIVGVGSLTTPYYLALCTILNYNSIKLRASEGIECSSGL